MNMDRHNDGLKDGGASSSSGPQNGPPQDRGEIDAMLKRGAHDIFLNDDDSAFQQFAGQDIDEILATSTKIDHNTDTGGGASVFSKRRSSPRRAGNWTWTTPSSGRRYCPRRRRRRRRSPTSS